MALVSIFILNFVFKAISCILYNWEVLPLTKLCHVGPSLWQWHVADMSSLHNSQSFWHIFLTIQNNIKWSNQSLKSRSLDFYKVFLSLSNGWSGGRELCRWHNLILFLVFWFLLLYVFHKLFSLKHFINSSFRFFLNLSICFSSHLFFSLLLL